MRKCSACLFVGKLTQGRHRSLPLGLPAAEHPQAAFSQDTAAVLLDPAGDHPSEKCGSFAKDAKHLYLLHKLL